MTPEDMDREEETQEEEHTKTDTRASSQPEPEAEEAPPETPPAEDAPTDEPPAEDGERPDIDVYSLLRMSIGMYAQQAWVHLGLVKDPYKDTTEMNLPMAQIAIDTVAFMAEKLGDELDEGEKREMDSLLTNLRINFAQRS